VCDPAQLGLDVEALVLRAGRAVTRTITPIRRCRQRGHLIAHVAAGGAEVGIALDGDADRIGVVDARGRIVWGDQLHNRARGATDTL